MTTAAVSLAPARVGVLRRRIRWIVAATIAYNVIEAVVAIAAGSVASSTALIGFGLDSIVEVLSAAAVAWQFAGRDPEARERTALRVIAVSFFGLAVVVSVDAVLTFTGVRSPEHSPVGIVLAAVSLAVMPFLSLLERRTGRELGSASAIADSKQTLICSYLSAAVLLGLLANSLFGWWWADPLAGLVVVVFAVREGLEAWRGDACKQPVSALTGSARATAATAAERSLPAVGGSVGFGLADVAHRVTDDVRDVLVVQRVDGVPPDALDLHDAREPQRAEVLGHQGLRQLGRFGEGADVGRLGDQRRQDPESGG